MFKNAILICIGAIKESKVDMLNSVMINCQK